jgi:tRNA-uridine 2-sulfurtransferase
MKKIKALLLFSGGLDSILAAKVLQEQGIHVDGITFRSCFFDETQANQGSKSAGINIKIVDFSKKHLVMVKNPKHGYGKNMNPCIDCHLMMIVQSSKIRGYDFIATGEVLGERPMSQNKRALDLLTKEAGVEILRPLSAQLLDKTQMEKDGLVDRGKLLSISGRSRKPQLELVQKYNISWFPTPAGGCLLTDPEFSKKLKALTPYKFNENDTKLLKVGRHFWYDDIKIVVGRDAVENDKIKELRNRKDKIIELHNISGPTTLVRAYKGRINKESIEKAKELTKHYSVKARDMDKVEYDI